MNIEQRKGAFVQLGEALSSILSDNNTADTTLVQQHRSRIEAAIEQARVLNNWFTTDNSRAALQAIAHSLRADAVNQWLAAYQGQLDPAAPKQVGVVMAGNIPLVGFHDALCVLASGHKLLGKLSTDDKVLLPAVVELLVAIEPAFAPQIKFIEDKLSGMEAVIATGSNNTARYFEHYFGKYPNIIRQNRTSVAVLTGEENEEEMTALGADILTYFGLGCRSVSKVFVPKGYDIDHLYKGVFPYSSVHDNNKYANNYGYNRAIWLMDTAEFFDNGFLLLKHDTGMASPVASVFLEEYASQNDLLDRLNAEKEQIQCIVSRNDVPFGKAQQPELWDYADGIDTMEFLGGL